MKIGHRQSPRLNQPPHPEVQTAIPLGGASWKTIVGESAAGVVDRPLRSALTALGTVLGVGMLVCIMGITSTIRQQISAGFDLRNSNEILVRPSDGQNSQTRYLQFPDDAVERIAQIHGVVSGSLTWQIPPKQVSAHDGMVAPADVALTATDATLFSLVDARFSGGRAFTDASPADPRVAVVGARAAQTLHLGPLQAAPSIVINGWAYTVVGILDDSASHPELRNHVLVSRRQAIHDFGPPGPGSELQMIVMTRPGSAQVVGPQLSTALRPDQPRLFSTVLPPDPTTMRQQIDGSLQKLLLFLAVVTLIIGMAGIANTSFVSVMERTGEIGLRRALGARRGEIAAQFLTEAGLLGLLGGLVGASLGIVITVSVAAVNHWTAVVPTWLLPAGPGLGIGVGVLSGLVPAQRAARIEPVEALRA